MWIKGEQLHAATRAGVALGEMIVSLLKGFSADRAIAVSRTDVTCEGKKPMLLQQLLVGCLNPAGQSENTLGILGAVVMRACPQ